MKCTGLLLLMMLLLAPAASADIFRYVDEEGVICYTDSPRGKKADRIYKDRTEPASVTQPITRPRPSEYHDIIHAKASQYDLDPSLIKAVITTESNWDRRAVSRKGAMGLMQLMPATATEMNVRDPYNPEDNIEGGTKYLRYLLERFNGDLTLALAAYNAGPKTVEKYGYVPPITETKQYVRKVLSLYNGQTVLSFLSAESVKSRKKYEPIYKVVLDDGSMLFTNSSLISKTTARF
jgi:hypothetical protein